MSKKPMPRVVIRQDEFGDFTVFADEGVTVFWVDERAPSDRVYQMELIAVPEGMLDGTIGRRKDGSSADARAHAIVARRDGKSHLAVVETDTGAEG